MKILMINVVCGIRSTGRICTDLATELERQGHEVKIAYGREKVPEQFQKYAVRIGTDFDVYLHALKARLFDSAGFESKRVTKKFVEWIKEYDPDVIHLHNLHGYHINVEILFQYLRECGKKIIWTLHDCWAFTGHCAHYSLAKCDQWETRCVNCRQLREYPECVSKGNVYANYERKKWLFTKIARMHIIVPSNWLASQIKKSFLQKYPISVIPNGVDLSKFKPTAGKFREVYHLGNKKILLGVASAWSKGKGLSRFHDLASRLSDSEKIVLVGVSKRQSRDLDSNILCIEKTDNLEKLAEIYTNADIYLNLSEQETMGLTTVEAMACGTPVIVSNLTAVPEVVQQNGGVILPDLETDSILRAIDYVLSQEYLDTVKNAQRYEKEKQYRKYIEILIRECE